MDDKNINYYHLLLEAKQLVLAAAMMWTQSIGNMCIDDINITFTDLSSNNVTM